MHMAGRRLFPEDIPAREMSTDIYARKLMMSRPVARGAATQGGVTEYRGRCVDCGAVCWVSPRCPPDWRVCDDCGRRRAHEVLYGHEECRDCGCVLVGLDEQKSNYCRRCDGVDDMYADSDEDDADDDR